MPSCAARCSLPRFDTHLSTAPSGCLLALSLNFCCCFRQVAMSASRDHLLRLRDASPSRPITSCYGQHQSHTACSAWRQRFTNLMLHNVSASATHTPSRQGQFGFGVDQRVDKSNSEKKDSLQTCQLRMKSFTIQPLPAEMPGITLFNL